MRGTKKLAAAGMLMLAVYLLSASGLWNILSERIVERLGDRRMRNVTVQTQSPLPAFSETEAMPSPAQSAAPLPREDPDEPEKSELPFIYSPPVNREENIQETTIEGGLSIKNETSYWVDAAKIISAGPGITLDALVPQILIIHTHSSEAYTQAGLDRYEASDTNRTENTEFNIVRIGDELTQIFQDAGLNVIHDRGIYDYPSYTGSYTRSGEAVERYLKDYPSIKLVLDIHRDALGADGVVYKTMAEEDGVVSSQIMLLVGTDESGLEHPNWRQNLAAALYLQNAVHAQNPTLMRPISLVRERYNQHLSPGFIIMEVGSNGNTLQEALAAIRLFGRAAAPALTELIE